MDVDLKCAEKVTDSDDADDASGNDESDDAKVGLAFD